jgi:BirA family biotin operon repressor/biotin-[acetyl-CoA-carboxylase] ligase
MTGTPFVILPVTDSTNNHAMNEVRTGMVTDGAAFFALEQTQGKGQRGKSWVSTVAQNIMISVVWDAKGFSLQRPFPLSALVALACQDFFSRYALDGVCIKWPNDIYWNDRKAGGILIENIIRKEEWEKSIIGIGLNINQTVFPSMERKAVSLKQITGKEFDPVMLAKELCADLDRFRNLFEKHGFQPLLEQYNLHLFARGKAMKFRKGNILLQARVDGVDENGCLKVTHAHADSWEHGTVDWLL